MERAARHRRESIHLAGVILSGRFRVFRSVFQSICSADPNKRSSVSIAGLRFVTCNAIKIRVPKFERSRSPFLFRIISFSFSHSPVLSASVPYRRFLSLAFRSLFHIPESSVGCGRSCPLVVARKRCRGLRSTGSLHARLPAYIEISDHSHDTGRWPSIAIRTRWTRVRIGAPVKRILLPAVCRYRNSKVFFSQDAPTNDRYCASARRASPCSDRRPRRQSFVLCVRSSRRSRPF